MGCIIYEKKRLNNGISSYPYFIYIFSNYSCQLSHNIFIVINNTKKRKRQKFYSLRVNIEESIHFLLLAGRKIHKGEILYYDYKAEEYNNYNTSNFE